MLVIYLTNICETFLFAVVKFFQNGYSVRRMTRTPGQLLRFSK